MQHLPDQIDAEDVKLCFVMNNLFSENICQTSYDGKGPPSGTMNFDLFKKVFFNHLYLVQDDCQSNADRRALSIKNSLKHNSTQQPAIIEARINAMDKMIKMKFSDAYHTVRQAFLALDTDYDGYVTLEDILRHFDKGHNFNGEDLKKLITDKDSKKTGRINYSDFSRWLGSSIHMPEGFYFRHDSVKNP